MPRRKSHIKDPNRVRAGKHPSALQRRNQTEFAKKAKQAAALMRQGYTRKQAWAQLKRY
jgi:hypothetical protein